MLRVIAKNDTIDIATNRDAIAALGSLPVPSEISRWTMNRGNCPGEINPKTPVIATNDRSAKATKTASGARAAAVVAEGEDAPAAIQPKAVRKVLPTALLRIAKIGQLGHATAMIAMAAPVMAAL